MINVFPWQAANLNQRIFFHFKFLLTAFQNPFVIKMVSS